MLNTKEKSRMEFDCGSKGSLEANQNLAQQKAYLLKVAAADVVVS
jgi:hypothetical protein